MNDDVYNYIDIIKGGVVVKPIRQVVIDFCEIQDEKAYRAGLKRWHKWYGWQGKVWCKLSWYFV